MATVKERVAAGVIWLDEHQPRWIDSIDVAGLDMGECHDCVLGQVYGNFVRAPIEATLHGAFDLVGDEPIIRFRTLTREWRRVIRSLKAVA